MVVKKEVLLRRNHIKKNYLNFCNFFLQISCNSKTFLSPWFFTTHQVDVGCGMGNGSAPQSSTMFCFLSQISSRISLVWTVCHIWNFWYQATGNWSYTNFLFHMGIRWHVHETEQDRKSVIKLNERKSPKYISDNMKPS